MTIELPPDCDWSVIARRLESMVGLAEGRLTVEGTLEIMPGKSTICFEGNPRLTDEEYKKVEEALYFLNALVGGSPPIKHGTA
jgi:hypothetical protein